MCIWEMPESKKELYENGDNTYRAQEYSSEFEMDNIQALSWFIDYIEIENEDFIYYDGTQCQIKIKDKEFQIDSGGFGDFYSHKFDVIEV